jgi:predicted phosphohydrolase
MTDDLGYYIVENEKFYNKVEAFFKAKQIGLKRSQIKWDFNDSVFQALDWTVEPTTSLEDFYYLRAKQIREQYDYVLMFVSGGADSTNMLFSFLSNGFHVDEIVASAPLSGLRDWDHKKFKDDDVKNTIEETFVTQLPFLEKVRIKFPKTKITLHDYFEDMLNYKPDEWLIKGSDWMHPTMAGRYNLDRYLHLKRIAESGKKIAIVQGIDKPQLARFKDTFALVIGDYAYNNKYDSILHPNTFPVFFYHTPDLPQLMIKQAHVTARFLMRPENHEIYKVMPYNWEYAKFRDEPSKNLRCNGVNGGVYERGIVPAIYPSIKKWSYQAQKPDKMFLGNHDYWFYEHHQSTHIYQMMVSDLNHIINHFPKDYFYYHPFTNEILGFSLFFKSYILGNVENFTPKDIILTELPNSKKMEDMFQN